MKKLCENGTGMGREFDNFRNVASQKIEFAEKGVPTETTIRIHQNRGLGGFAEKEGIQKKRTSLKMNIPKNMKITYRKRYVRIIEKSST